MEMDSVVRGSDVRDCHSYEHWAAAICCTQCPQVFVQLAAVSTDCLGVGAV